LPWDFCKVKEAAAAVIVFHEWTDPSAPSLKTNNVNVKNNDYKWSIRARDFDRSDIYWLAVGGQIVEAWVFGWFVSCTSIFWQIFNGIRPEVVNASFGDFEGESLSFCFRRKALVYL
jgi:hypothetical protein